MEGGCSEEAPGQQLAAAPGLRACPGTWQSLEEIGDIAALPERLALVHQA